MEKKKNTPKLRFPEFTGEWEEKKLGEITTKLSDGLHSTPKYTDDSVYYFIKMKLAYQKGFIRITPYYI